MRISDWSSDVCSSDLPVILDVLTRGEMAITPVIFARDPGKHMQLLAAERDIGNGNEQHIGMELKIEAIHQPQRLELICGYFACETTRRLSENFLPHGTDPSPMHLNIHLPYQPTEIGTGKEGSV